MTFLYFFGGHKKLKLWLLMLVETSKPSKLGPKDKVTCASDFDRAFIYKAIDSWYGSKDAFTKFVRGPLREELLDLLPSPHLPWTYAAFILSGPLTYRVQLGFSLFHAGADAQPLLMYAMSSAAYIFGWLWPSFNGLFFLCDKTSTSGETWCVSVGKTLVVTLATFMCLFISEGLAIVVLRAEILICILAMQPLQLCLNDM